MLVSVVIPVYNRKDFIRKCLESVLDQDFEGDFEVIVVDDGSTDGTLEVLNEFLPRIKLHLNQFNQGVSAARNQGVRLCQGKFVVMTDSDCIASPNWLSELIRPFEQDNSIMIVGGKVDDMISNNYWQLVNNGFNTFVAKTSGYADRVIGCNMVLRQEFALKQPYDERLTFAAGDDTDLCWFCREHGFKVYYTDLAKVSHHHRSTLKSSLVQQFLYGYVNTYLCIKYEMFPFVPYGSRILVLLLLCLILVLVGFKLAWLAIGICLVSFSYICWFHDTKASVKNLYESIISYPGNYLLYTVFCIGNLVYFLVPCLFIKQSDPICTDPDHQPIKYLPLCCTIILWKLFKDEIQFHWHEILYIGKRVISKKNCNVLVFGMGHDSTLWKKINTNGRTVFLEDDKDWFEKITNSSIPLEAYLINYGTNITEWRALLDQPDRLEIELPSSIQDTLWDIIIVDGPCGELNYYMNTYGCPPPGRMKSIYMASKLIKKGGVVFVHDCEREVEMAYCDKYLLASNCTGQIKGRALLRRYLAK